MPFVQAKCPECGGMLAVDADKKAANCQFCGEAFIVQEAINNYNTYNETINNYNTTHQYGDGAVVNVYENKSKDFVIEAGVLKEYHGESADIIIPDNVTQIGCKAFAGSGIVSISIPQSVVKVEFDAFAGCEKLSKVIYNGSFVEWNAIDFVTNGASMQTSNPNLYAENLYINGEYIDESFIIPDGIEKIGKACFCGCVNLNTVIIPNTVKEIGDLASQNCVNLNSIEIPNSVKKIGRQAFSNCSKLLNITLSNGLESIEYRAFYNCSSLQGLEIPDSVRIIDSYVFENCKFNWIKIPGNVLKNFLIQLPYTKDIKITLPQTIEELILTNRFSDEDTEKEIEGRKHNILSYLSNLIRIKINDGITSIGSRAFFDCKKLNEISLPKTLLEIKSSAFSCCESLEYIFFPDCTRTIEYHTFWGCTNLKCVNLSNDLIKIGDEAFYDCSNLEKINLPNELEYIGFRAFYGCNKLTALNIPNKLSKNIQIDAGRNIEKIRIYGPSIFGNFMGEGAFNEVWKYNKKCQHCGGELKYPLFGDAKCKICGMKKDY